MAAGSRADFARAEQRLQADVYDVDAWNLLLSVADKLQLEEGRQLYERYLTVFPTAVRPAALPPAHAARGAHARSSSSSTAGRRSNGSAS